MDYSQDQKNQMAQMLRQELARQKAEELGVDSTDVMQRVSDGKSAWVRKSEVYVQLDKQRKLVVPPKVIRSLRDGRNSLVARIEREIAACRKLYNDSFKSHLSDSSNLSEIKTAITKLENRTHSIANQLNDVENRIDRLKSSDPVFSQAESVLAKIREAQEKNDVASADSLMAGNKDLLNQFEFQRKSMTPYLEDARKYRLELQREYSAIMQNRFRLQAIFIQQIKSQLAMVASNMQKQGEQAKLLSTTTKLLQEDAQNAKQFRNLVAHTPPSHVPSQEACNLWDCILPEMEKIVDNQADLCKQFREFLNQHHGKETPSELSQKRMAFTQQKR